VPYRAGAFPNDVSKLSAASDGYQLAIRGSLELAGTLLAADPVSVRAGLYVHSAALGAEVARRLARNQKYQRFPGVSGTFPRERHNT
jgi:hypothetical protein